MKQVQGKTALLLDTALRGDLESPLTLLNPTSPAVTIVGAGRGLKSRQEKADKETDYTRLSTLDFWEG